MYDGNICEVLVQDYKPVHFDDARKLVFLFVVLSDDAFNSSDYNSTKCQDDS
jgi:hypothetical protein